MDILKKKIEINTWFLMILLMKTKSYSKKYEDVWDGVKKKINYTKENNYENDYMKIKFNSDDNLPLNKPLKFHNMTITIRSVFEEDGKLYELNV